MALNPTVIYDKLEELVLTTQQALANADNGTERNGTERNGTERNGTERNGTERNANNFIFDFLQLFSIAKSTITKLKSNTQNTNKADFPSRGEVALAQYLYFKPCWYNSDLYAEIEQLKCSSVVKTNKIRFLIATDFDNFEAYDLKAEESLTIPFNELHQNYAFFLPLAGIEKAVLVSENPADVKAAEKMGRLFDAIRANNSLSPHQLNLFLTRLLFCFFAEDTQIFNKQAFTLLMKNHTADVSLVQPLLQKLFSVLNLPENSPERATMPAHLTVFPYVNGGLFAEESEIPQFTPRAKRLLLECGELDWSAINPDIFGSMFQAVVSPEQRAKLGQHYTSVKNIMKVIKPLFLDPLYQEFEKFKQYKDDKTRKERLIELLSRLANIKIFDPACGSGNFLIIAYKELKRLEIQILKALFSANNELFAKYDTVELSQFYGLEIDDFACETARLSLYLAEHQMKQEMAQVLAITSPTLPLKNITTIKCTNSLRENWEQSCPRSDRMNDEVYIIGNPPFMGKNGRTAEQTAEMESVFTGVNSFKSLDYVASWFYKGAKYIAQSNSKLSLVATNSICQGEQVATLWKPIFQLGVQIHFAYQTFSWKNSAKDNAAVHTIIVGLSAQEEKEKTIFAENNGELTAYKAENINGYLIDGASVIIGNRKKSLNGISEMIYGNEPRDGGFLIFSESEKENFLSKEPFIKKYIKRLASAEDLINSKNRYCFWLVGEDKKEFEKSSIIKERLEKVISFRKTAKPSTQKMANYPHLFESIRQPESSYLIIPSVSSENRKYIPLGFVSSDVISTNANFTLPNCSLYEFAILTSEMHNDWMRVVAGRLKSDYRYSNTLVYNNFPFPEVTEKQKAEISQLAEEILVVRAGFPEMTLAQMYNPDTMPQELKLAHETLDKAVEKLYRDKPFDTAAERVAFLFKRYEQLTSGRKGGK